MKCSPHAIYPVLLSLQIIITFVLISAMLVQIYFKVIPCELCMFQRICWMLILLITFIYPKKILILAGLIANAGVAIYQISLEQAWLTKICSIDPRDIPCDVVTFSLFGLSLASYNLIIILLLILYILIYYKKLSVYNNY
ncbi:Disulfide bond formation protein B [Candidatus Hepatincolaceae symbiont of Richtersius coronifer]